MQTKDVVLKVATSSIQIQPLPLPLPPPLPPPQNPIDEAEKEEDNNQLRRNKEIEDLEHQLQLEIARREKVEATLSELLEKQKKQAKPKEKHQ